MKFVTFVTTCLSFITLVNSQLVNPAYVNLEQDLVERDDGNSSLIDGILDGAGDLLSDIDIEKIAGWADTLLEIGGEEILEGLLVWLKNTNLLPEATIYIVTHNWTLELVQDLLPVLIDLAGAVNLTTVFVALDRSGIVYSTIKGILQDEDFFPSVLDIVEKTLDGTDLSGLLGDAVDLISRDDVELPQLGQDFHALQKRDNVEDLLTHILQAVNDSGLVTDLITTLVSDSEFQDATATLLQGAFQNVGSLVGSVDFDSLKPILSSLWASGLLQHTIEEALSDGDFFGLILRDIEALFTNNKIKRDDLRQRTEALLQKVKRDVSVNMTSSVMAPEETGTGSSSIMPSAVVSESYDPEDDALRSNVNKWALGMGLVAPVLLM